MRSGLLVEGGQLLSSLAIFWELPYRRAKLRLQVFFHILLFQLNFKEDNLRKDLRWLNTVLAVCE